MKLKLYAVRDGATGAFLPPFVARADGEARRMFMGACTNGPFKNMEVYYAMFHIGYYDDVNGQLESVSQPAPIMTGLEAIAQDKNLIQMEKDNNDHAKTRNQ